MSASDGSATAGVAVPDDIDDILDGVLDSFNVQAGNASAVHARASGRGRSPVVGAQPQQQRDAASPLTFDPMARVSRPSRASPASHTTAAAQQPSADAADFLNTPGADALWNRGIGSENANAPADMQQTLMNLFAELACAAEQEGGSIGDLQEALAGRDFMSTIAEHGEPPFGDSSPSTGPIPAPVSAEQPDFNTRLQGLAERVSRESAAVSPPAAAPRPAPTLDYGAMLAGLAERTPVAPGAVPPERSATGGGGGLDFAAMMAGFSAGQGASSKADEEGPAGGANFMSEMSRMMGLAEGGGVEDESEMEDFLQSVLNQFISKDVLNAPMQELLQKYPAWLIANVGRLPAEDFARYSQQYSYVKEICRLFDEEPDNTTDIRAVLELVQSCGSPPEEIAKLATDVPEGGLPSCPMQ